MKIKIFSTIFILMTCFTFGVETPAPAEAKKEVTVKEKMTVTATRTEKAFVDVPNSITLIPVEELEQRLGSGSIADMLTDVPGIELRDSSVAGGKRLIIRGEGGNRVLVLIDGQRVSEQKSMDGIPLLVDATNIEQIEVVKGPSSVLYGSDALGGVVNIITRKNGDNDGLSGRVSGSYNSGANGYVGGLSLSGNYNPFTFHIAASKTDHGDRETPIGTIENTGYIYDTLTANFSWTLDLLKLGLYAEKFEGSMESAYTDPEPPMTSFLLDLPSWDRKKIGLSLESLTSHGNMAKYRFDIYSQQTYKDLYNDMGFSFAPGMPDSTIHLQTENDLDSLGAFFQADFTLGENHYLIAGIDVLQDKLDSIEIQDTTGFGPFPTHTQFFYIAQMNTLAFFLQDEWKVSDKLTAYLGVRDTLLDVSLDDTDNTALEIDDSSDSKFIGSLGLLLTPNERYNIRLNLSQGFRYGTLQQLFIGTSHGSRTPTFPNQNLKPELSENIELGMRLLNSKVGLDVATFYNNAENYITTAIVDGRRSFANIDEAKTYGGEINLDYQFDNGFKPYLEGTVLKRQFTSSGFSTYNTGHPDLIGRLGLQYSNSKGSGGYSANLYFKHNSFTNESYSEGDEIQNIDFPSWTTLNLLTSFHFGKNGQFKGGLSVYNMTDELYTVASEVLVSPGRHFVLNIGTSF